MLCVLDPQSHMYIQCIQTAVLQYCYCQWLITAYVHWCVLVHSDLDSSSDESEEVDSGRDRGLAVDFTPVADQPGLYYKVLN